MTQLMKKHVKNQKVRIEFAEFYANPGHPSI